MPLFSKLSRRAEPALPLNRALIDSKMSILMPDQTPVLAKSPLDSEGTKQAEPNGEYWIVYGESDMGQLATTPAELLESIRLVGERSSKKDLEIRIWLCRTPGSVQVGLGRDLLKVH